MSTPTDLERFIGYAQAFELAQAGEAWPVLEPHFCEDAVHLVHNGGSLGGDDHGRAAVVDGLKQSVHDHDRRFDVRIPEILEGPVSRPDGVWMRYALTLRRAGVPELRFEGEHLTEYEDGRICRIEEWLPADTPQRVETLLAEHDARLHPPGSPPRTPNARDRRDLEAATAGSLIRAYGSAKSQQDVGAALAFCSPDFALETPAFGTRAVGRDAVAAQLAVFFRAFPDYRVKLEGFAQGDAAVTWGRAKLSLRGALLGLEPTHKTAELPVYCLFDVREGMLRSERFVFDRASFCEQLELPAPALAEALATLARGDSPD
ncbi:MAG: ester cyclase [Proteobacteria bacterium]|nr:ester cyclase [Pseudomonadota bacterium]